MIISLIIMMVLYGGWLFWVVLAFSFIYFILRMVTYLVYRQLNEEQIIKGAKAPFAFYGNFIWYYNVKIIRIGK